jgi:hypothetical protein
MLDLMSLNVTDKQTAALQYHAAGWRVIPLTQKRPVTNWTTDPPLNARALSILFTDTDFNIGVVMGQPSGLVGLDIDGADGIEDLATRFALPQLEEYNIRDITRTLSFRTPSGGLRFLYQYDPRITSRSLRVHHKETIRIMSDGTQTVAPPSSIAGRPYTWLSGERLAPCPVDAILKLAQSDKPPTTIQPTPDYVISKSDAFHRARAYVLKCDPAISGQGGHNQLFKVAVRLVKGFRLSKDEALAILRCDYNPICQPPWTEAELIHKIEDAANITTPYRSMI